MGNNTSLPHGIRYAFSGAMESVEEWLATHCNGMFSVGFDGIDDDATGFARKCLLIFFELPEDKVEFTRAAREGRIG